MPTVSTVAKKTSVFAVKRAVRVTIYRRRLQEALIRKERRVLFRSGAWGRGFLRRLIRRRKKAISKPGNPPFAHAPGSSGLKDVRYEVELSKGRVVFGHRKYPRRIRKRGSTTYVVASFKPVPQLLNEGGTAAFVYRIQREGSVQRKTVHATYRARPFRAKTRDASAKFMMKLMRTERLK